MNHLTRRSALVGAVGICLSAGRLALAGGPESKAIAWQASLKSAHKVALEQNKPMLLVFGAEWCTWCKKLEKNTLSNPQLAKYINSTFVSVHIDFDEEPKIAQILDVKSLPCTIVLSPDADLLGRYDKYMEPSEMYKKLTAARKLHLDTQQQTAGVSR